MTPHREENEMNQKKKIIVKGKNKHTPVLAPCRPLVS